MKKGFTMIELIFVIVILGILASVAIPRLAATREDAEISDAVANLRTLLSDINSYYAAKGEFGSTTKWNEITNVPLNGATSAAVGDKLATAHLKAGKEDCIGVYLLNKDENRPALITFTPKEEATGVCGQVIEAEPVKAYVNSSLNLTSDGKQITIQNVIAIGSTTSVY